MLRFVLRELFLGVALIKALGRPKYLAAWLEDIE